VSWAVLIVGSYLLGSISWSYVVVRLARGEDVRRLGSGNAGATNVAGILGLPAGLGVLALDMGKGALPCLVAVELGVPGPVVGTTATAAVLGHVFPVFLGFRGGKGVATAAGTMLCLAPLPAAMGLLLFVLVAAWSRYVAIGSIVAVVTFPLWLYATAWLDRSGDVPLWLLASTAVTAIVVVVRHRDNLQRIRDGSEMKLGRTHGRKEVT
jgi:glycerol-3-phosphate acyltransferase PlsY